MRLFGFGVLFWLLNMTPALRFQLPIPLDSRSHGHPFEEACPDRGGGSKSSGMGGKRLAGHSNKTRWLAATSLNTVGDEIITF